MCVCVMYVCVLFWETGARIRTGITVKSWRLKMEPWRVYRPMVADSHPFDEDPDPHYTKKSDPDHTLK
jgi:hypothetical protein